MRLSFLLRDRQTIPHILVYPLNFLLGTILNPVGRRGLVRVPTLVNASSKWAERLSVDRHADWRQNRQILALGRWPTVNCTGDR